jgi:hypothetical protein
VRQYLNGEFAAANEVFAFAALPPDVRKASGFPATFDSIISRLRLEPEAKPPTINQKRSNGKAQPFRTSGGEAVFRCAGVAKPSIVSFLSSDLTPAKETNQFARLFDHRHSTHAIALDQFIRRVHVG